MVTKFEKANGIKFRMMSFWKVVEKSESNTDKVLENIYIQNKKKSNAKEYICFI